MKLTHCISRKRGTSCKYCLDMWLWDFCHIAQLYVGPTLLNATTSTNTRSMLWPLCRFQSFLSMHQFCHLRSQPFVSKTFTWILPLLLHQPFNLCQGQEGEQLEVAAKRPHYTPLASYYCAQKTCNLEGGCIVIVLTKMYHHDSSSPTLPRWNRAASERTGRIQREMSCLCWATLRCLQSSPACPLRSWSLVEWWDRTPPHCSLCRGVSLY